MKEQFFASKVGKNYNLRHHIEGKPSPIYLVLRIDKKQYKIPLGVKVLPEHWKKDKAMVSFALNELDNSNNDIVNKKIMEYDQTYYEFLLYLCNHIDELNNIPSVISRHFNMGRKKKEIRLCVAARLKQLVLEQQMKKSSKDSYMQEIKCFEEFIGKRTIYLEDVDVALMREYIKHLRTLTDTHKITKEKVFIEDNTVASKFKKMLTIFGYADKADLYDASKITKLKDIFKTDKTEENQVYLNDEEMSRVLALELTEHLDIARDLFVFQMELGQRISDILDLMGKDLRPLIKNDKLIIYQVKTNHKVTPPITDIAKSILEKYNYVLPKMTSNRINANIKTVCQMANITEICDCIEMRGGKPYKYSCQKYLLVASHTCRRSFISQHLLAGVDASVIRKISGHSTDSAFQRYNRLSSEDAADVLMKVKKSSPQGSNSSEVDNVPSDNIPVDTVSGNGKSSGHKEEYRRVLTMLQVNPVEWIDIEDEEELFRMIVSMENNIAERCGVDYKYLKDIFNNPDIDMRDKVNIINNLLK